MPAVIILGTHWGDEGKGKGTDLFSENADITVKFNGGNNAGHSVVIGNKKFALHSLPSGVLRKGVINYITNGAVINIEEIIKEIDKLNSDPKINISPKNLKISNQAHIVTNENVAEDKKDKKIGTTGKGIGPTYSNKAKRIGIRTTDLDKENTLKKYITNTTQLLNDDIKKNKKIIFEGGQGTMLDLDHGTYPFVTSSNTIAGGVCTGAGIAPKHIKKVIGIMKAYTTRVGEGPFPTELTKETEINNFLVKNGQEFGVTTGRERRCGWFDGVIGKFSVMVNGIEEILLTKIDILTGLEKIKLCHAYKINEKIYNVYPNNTKEFELAKPLYYEFEGWDEKIKGLTDYNKLPKNAIHYIKAIEDLVECKINFIGTGPERKEIICLKEPKSIFV